MRGPGGHRLRLALVTGLAACTAASLCGCFGAPRRTEAPAPRAASAAPPAAATAPHPDFSGVWTWYLVQGQSPFRRRKLDLPFTPLAKQKVDAYQALVQATSDNPGAHCLGSGMPADMMFSGGYPMEIVETPDLIMVLYEAWSEIRQIYLGDKIIPPADRLPDREGYSAAHWEGDTLVVETGSLKEQEDQMYPHSAEAHIVERYHLATDARGAKVLIDDWTLTDPVFYTRPISFEKKWALDPKGILLPYECNEEGWLDHLDALRKAHAAGASRRVHAAMPSGQAPDAGASAKGHR